MNAIKENELLIKKLENMEYYKPTAEIYDQKIKKFKKSGLSSKEANLKILNHLTSILTESQYGVEKIIKTKMSKGEISDDKQARKAIAAV